MIDSTGKLHAARSNEVYTTGGSLVSFVEEDYNYDTNGSWPNRTHNWLSSVTTTFHWLDTSGYPTWRSWLLSQNAYTYDNSGQRLTNQVTVALTTGTGGPQYSGGSPTYGSSQPDLFSTGYGATPATNQLVTTRNEKYQKSDGSSGYDSLNRLTNVDYGDGQTQAYTFDAMGNRLSRQDSVSGTTNYAVNAANMLLSTTGTGASSYGNDADGNTLTGNGRTSTWDSQNRMVSCIITGSSSTFKYGADGLRRQKTTNGTTTDYAYDATMMVREGVASGGTLSTVKATYLIGPRGPEYRRDDTATELDGQGRTVTKARWYVYDGLGSVVGEVDPLGNLTSSPKYDVYGAVRANSGTATTKQGFVGGLGHLSEAETGLVYMRARYMDPSTGRFESEDPSLQGKNWFVYCGNNPITQADESGRSFEDAFSLLGFSFSTQQLLNLLNWSRTASVAQRKAVAEMLWDEADGMDRSARIIRRIGVDDIADGEELNLESEGDELGAGNLDIARGGMSEAESAVMVITAGEYRELAFLMVEDL